MAQSQIKELRSGRLVGELDTEEEIERIDEEPDAEEPTNKQVAQWLKVIATRAENTAPVAPSGEITQIPYFSGEQDNSLTVAEFIDRFNLVARLWSWKNDLRAKYLPLYLRGRALEFYATLPRATQKDYSKLVITLKQTFVDMHRSRCAAIELRTRTKLENETIFE